LETNTRSFPDFVAQNAKINNKKRQYSPDLQKQKSRTERGAARRLMGYSDGNYVYNLAIATNAELHIAVHQSVQRVILTQSNVLSCMELGAALANNNVSSHNSFSTELLNAKILRL